jgi:beta-galactosidase
VDENATVFLNGRMLGRYLGWNKPFDVTLKGVDTLQKPLQLTLFIENYSNEGGIDKPVRANYQGQGIAVTEWHMRGGPGDPEKIGDWKTKTNTTGRSSVPDSSDLLRASMPCFFRTEFRAPPYASTGTHPVWRVHTQGLGHGSVWVNGHNLGRYPEKSPAPGLYIPECWIKAGPNTLIIYDEDGKYPGQVSVRAEMAAGRELALFSNY